MTAPITTPSYFQKTHDPDLKYPDLPPISEKPNPNLKHLDLPAIPEKMIFSPNGEHLVVGFFDKRRVVHFNGENRYTIRLRDPVDSMAAANDGTVVTSSLAFHLTIWQREKDQTIETSSWVRGVAISPDGDLVVAGKEDGSCSLHRRTGGLYHEYLNFVLASPITTLTLTPSGTYLALGTQSGAIHLMDIQKQQRWSNWYMDREVISIALSDDGSQLFGRDIKNATSFWGSEKNEPIKGLECALTGGSQYAKITNQGVEICGKNPRGLDHPGARYVFMSRNGSTTVTICKRFATIWTEKPQMTFTSEPHKSCFTLAAISQDGRTIALGNDTSQAVTIIQINS